VVVKVEALKNICGASIFTDYDKYCDLNLRKFQEKVMEASKVVTVTVVPPAITTLEEQTDSSNVEEKETQCK
jgi:predicted amidohydrolase